MISADGAELIAQVYPVAILVLSLELRAVRDFKAKAKLHHIIYWVVGIAYVLTILASIVSVVLCVWSVSASEELSSLSATVVIASGLLLSLATGVTLLLILADRFGVLAKIDAQAGSPPSGP